MANKSVRGKCKLKDRWEAIPLFVVRKLQGIPSYVVRKAGTSSVRTLHRNMLMLCPFDVTPSEASSSGRDTAQPLPVEHASLDESSGVVLPPDDFQDTDEQQSHTTEGFHPDESSGPDDIPQVDSQGGVHQETTSCQDVSTPPATEDSLVEDSSSSDGELPARQLRRSIRPPKRFGDWL